MQVLISEAEIHARVAELGRQIEADYAGKPLTIVAVLTGSLIVLADLIRRIGLPLRVALLQASSYKGATTTAGDPHHQRGLRARRGRAATSCSWMISWTPATPWPRWSGRCRAGAP